MSITKNATILALDDEPINLLLINEYLGHLCKQLFLQNNVERALALAINNQPDIILLDIVMDEMDGYEVCRQLKAHETTKHIPVIFLSALLDSADKVKGFEAGGVDYIAKPFAPEEMLVRIESCLSLHEKIRLAQQNVVKISEEEKEEKIRHYKLSGREVETLRLYALGHKHKEIADQLFVSENTVKWYLKNIFEKLKIDSRSQAIEKSHEIGLI